MCSALISGSEVAYFSLSPSEMEELRNEDSKQNTRVLSQLKDPERLLATILITNNLVNVAIVIFSTYLSTQIWDFGSLKGWEKNLIEIGVITGIILLVGEVLPKVYATSNGLRLSRLMSGPIRLLTILFKPLSSFLISFSGITSRLVKNKQDISVDSLEHALELTMDSVDVEEQRILEGIVKFGNTDVKQVMTPRVSIHAIDIDMEFQEMLDKVIDYNHSRIPVYEGSLDTIKGLLYLKDLLPYIGINQIDWQTMVREPMFVPESKKIDDLLIEFKKEKIHMAIVVDEYGGTSGIITLEDVIEEIVGDITDEFDDVDISYSKLGENQYLIEGMTPLMDVYRIMDIDGEAFEQAKGESDTLAGFIIEQAGKIPLKNERIQFKNYNFTVESADRRKVRQVKVQIEPIKEEDE
jgi:gliding motility-associated protein GldE